MKIEEVLEKTKNVHALSTDEEKKTFYKYASKVPDMGTIVDIGTCAGGSAFIFALASKPSVNVVTIDPAENSSFIENLKVLDNEKKIIYIKDISESAVKKFAGDIDLIFIDGVHSYRGVKNDFTWFKPFMNKDTIIMFHDYYLYKNKIGKAIDELVDTGEIEKIEIIDSLYKGSVRTGLFISKLK